MSYKEREISRARSAARNFGAPFSRRAADHVNEMRRTKTGKFSGYWNSGRLQWSGRFENGSQVGLWTYHDKSGNDVTEIYFNL